MAEKGKVSIRNIRREGNEDLKNQLKEKIISEDESTKNEKNIQKITDQYIVDLEKIQLEKEKEILQIWTSLTTLPLSWMVMVGGALRKKKIEILAI